MVTGAKRSVELYHWVEQRVAAQIDLEGFPVWIVHLLSWGVLVLLILGILIGLTLWLQGRRIRQKATEAGINAPLPASGRDLRPLSETYPSRTPGWCSVPASSTGTGPRNLQPPVSRQAFSVSAQLAATRETSAVALFIGAPPREISEAASAPQGVGS